MIMPLLSWNISWQNWNQVKHSQTTNIQNPALLGEIRIRTTKRTDSHTFNCHPRRKRDSERQLIQKQCLTITIFYVFVNVLDEFFNLIPKNNVVGYRDTTDADITGINITCVYIYTAHNIPYKHGFSNFIGIFSCRQT